MDLAVPVGRTAPADLLRQVVLAVPAGRTGLAALVDAALVGLVGLAAREALVVPAARRPAVRHQVARVRPVLRLRRGRR